MSTFILKLIVFVSISVVFLTVFSTGQEQGIRYDPTWDSLEQRPLPEWYDKAKFGIFIHWGIFSVPSFSSEWFWWNWQGNKPDRQILNFMKRNYPPDFSYGDFGPQFTAEFYDPDWWADLFNASGAKYVVLTSKHHEGYTLWPSSTSFNWNSKDVGPHRDLVGELAVSIKNRTDIHFGLYHSLYEWFNPLYLLDKKTNFSTRYFPEMKCLPELMELINKYEPEVLWSDGDWEAPDSYWKSKEFLAWLYNDSPVKDAVVVNDRWGVGDMCAHGGYFTCSDRYNPGVLQKHKWENAMTIDKHSWGFRREATLEDYLTIEEILLDLVSTVSCGGNFLMNVGPSKDGRIAPIFEERLRQIGEWLSINGEAIYETVPWTHQNDTLNSNVWYTSKKQEDGSTNVYAIVLKWPQSNILVLGSVSGLSQTAINLVGDQNQLTWSESEKGRGILVSLPIVSSCSQSIDSKWAWVLKLENIISN